jgi:type I restriction enzyme, S subunit
MSSWREKQVKDLGEIITGRTPSTARKDFYDGDYNLISPADLDNGKYIRTAHKRLTKLGFEQCRGLPKGTVLVGCIGNVGKLGMVGNDKSATNQQINALICNAEHDPEFVYYCFHENRDKLEKRAVKTTVPILNKTNFGNFEVNVPPLPEQKKIAHILSTVQRAIEAQERIIQTTTELKKALMHKLFTEGLRNEPQKQTEIGSVPESWEVVELGEVARIERGKFSHRPRNEPRFYGGEYPFVQTGDVSNCDGYVRTYTQTLNEDGLAISKMFPAGTILITIAANIGFTGILEFDSACPDSLIGISPDESIQTEFLNYYLITQQPEMDRLAPKGTQKNINIQFLKPWPVPLPSVEEQTEIADAFSATDRKIRLATQKRNQLQDLFRTLLHELMTAKTRVHDLDFTA